MIIFTNHALLKLKQRGIAKNKVKQALKLPDYEIVGYSGRKIVYKKFDKIYLKVVYREENNNFIVITQHWESKPTLN